MRTADTVSGQREPEPSTQAEEALEEVPFPRYQIALVQDESEMLLQPQYDLFAALSDEPVAHRPRGRRRPAPRPRASPYAVRTRAARGRLHRTAATTARAAPEVAPQHLDVVRVRPPGSRRRRGPAVRKPGTARA